MSNIVTGVVEALSLADVGAEVLAWRRWHDPEPGDSVVVVTSLDDWSSTRTSAEVPTIRVAIYSAPDDGQENAESVGFTVATAVRAVLHRPQGGAVFWGDARVLQSYQVGGSLAEVEGHETWRVRILTFEVLTG